MWGYIDKENKTYIPFQFEEARDFDFGYAIVKKEGKYGYINITGQMVIPCDYESVTNFGSNIFAVAKQNGKYGYINRLGVTVVPFVFEDARAFSSNGVAPVKKDSKWGIIEPSTSTEIAEGNPIYACNNSRTLYEDLIDGYDYDFSFGSRTAKTSECLLMINGSFYVEKVMIENNCSLVPLRLVSEAFGATVTWDGAKSTVTVKDNGTIVMLAVGINTATVDGKLVNLDTPAIIKNGKTYVPLRFIAEGLKKSVGYQPGSGLNTGDLVEGKTASEVGIAYNPVVWVEDTAKMNNDGKTPNQVLEWLKPELTKSFNNLKAKLKTPNLEYFDDMENAFIQRGLTDIDRQINSTTYLGQVGRYAMFKSAYVTLVDMSTKSIYFYKTVHTAGWLVKANMDDWDNFNNSYFFD